MVGIIIGALCRERREAERRLAGLVDSLADLPDGAARSLVAQRIEQLNGECAAIERRMHELSGQPGLSDSEFDLTRKRLSAFGESIDGMTLQQQRAALCAVVRRILWDGETAHVELFGAEEATSPLREDSK